MQRIFFLSLFLFSLVVSGHAWSGVTASPNPSNSGNFTISWTGASDLSTVTETVNGNPVIVSFSSGSQFSVSGKPSGTYSYQVFTELHPSKCSYGCIPNVLGSVTVTVVAPGVPSSISSPSTSTTGTYTVSWGASSGSLTAYQLQERANGGSWKTIYTGSSRSRGFSKGANNYYDYRVRACNQSLCSAYRGNKRTTLPAASVTASVGNVAYTNVPFTLTWSSSMTTSCKWNGASLPNTAGSKSISVGTWGTLAMSGESYVDIKVVCNVIGGGTKTKTVRATTFGKKPLPNGGASWSKTKGIVGQSAYFRWDARPLADSCRIDNVSVGTSGSKKYTFSNSNTVTKTVICYNVTGSKNSTASIPVVYSTPGVPGGLSAPSSNTSGNYSVSWSAASGTVTSYTLQERTNNGSWTTMQTGTSRSDSYTNKKAGYYYDYRVRACNNSSCSGYSASKRTTLPAASVTVSLGSVPYTNVPFSLTWLSAMTTSCKWNSSSPGATAYINLPSVSGGQSIEVGSWGNISISGESYADIKVVCNVIGGGTKSKTVRATTFGKKPLPNAGASWSKTKGIVGQSAYFNWDARPLADSCKIDNVSVGASGSKKYTFSNSNTVTKTVICYNVTGSKNSTASIPVVYSTPGVPGGLSAPSSNTSGNYSVSWLAASGTVTSYTLQERTNNGSWTTVQTGTSRSDSYTNKKAGYIYDYRVRACNNSSCSGYSASKRTTLPAASVTVSLGSVPYTNVPFSLTWLSAMTTSCKWNSSSPGATAYINLPSVSGGQSIEVGSWGNISISGESYADIKVVCNVIGGGTKSKTVRATTFGKKPLPNAGASWSKTKGIVGQSAYFNWDARPLADSCKIDNVSVGASGSKKYTFSNSNTVTKTVICYNVTGNKSSSASIPVVYPTPGVPGGLTTPSSNTSGSYSVSWSAASGTVTSYTLQERTNNGSWTTVQTGTSRSDSYTNKKAGYIYDYRVRACNNSSCSGYSASKRTTLPAASVSPTVSDVQYSNTPFTLTWSSSMTTSCKWRSVSTSTSSFQNLSGVRGSQSIEAGNWGTENGSGLSYVDINVECTKIGGGTINETERAHSPGNKPLPAVTVSWNKPIGIIGESANVEWNSPFADYCKIDNITVEKNGVRPYSFSNTNTVTKTVTCYNVSGNRSGSSSIPVVYSTPGTPIYINIPANTNDGVYTISWPASSGTLTRYELQERKNGGAWVNIPLVNDTDLSKGFAKGPSDEYDYRVRACNHSSCSAFTTFGRIITPDASFSVGVDPEYIEETSDLIRFTWSSVMMTDCAMDLNSIVSEPLSIGDTSGISGSLEFRIKEWTWDTYFLHYESYFTLTCQIIGGGEMSRRVHFSAGSIPPMPEIDLFWSDSSVFVDESIELNWITKHTDTCELVEDSEVEESENLALNGERGFTFDTNGIVTKTITCSKTEWSVTRTTSRSVSIPVIYHAPTLSAEITSTYSGTEWGFSNIPFTLSWHSTSTANCRYFDSTTEQLDANNSGSNLPSNHSVSLAGVDFNWSQINPEPFPFGTQVTVSCEDLNGETITSIIDLAAEFNSPAIVPTVSVEWKASTVTERNEPVVFKWSSTTASSCQLNDDEEDVEPKGSRSVSFDTAGVKTWTVECSNINGSASASAAITIANSMYIPLLDFPVASDPENDGLTGEEYYGNLTGNYSVSKNGSFSYSIPIDVPPGINGMQPNIALAYSSDALNGLVGWGWSISGLSSISRCPSSLAQDGEISGINADDNYKFCLDGQRLVQLGTTNEYRTESETFKRITKESSYWLVEGPDGSKAFYGQEAGANSRLDDATPEETPITWFIDKQEDVSGNYLTYQYNEDEDEADSVTDAIRIQEIAYTFNASHSLANTLAFIYSTEDRSDISSKYIANTLVVQNKRLERIDAKANGNVVYSYHINYESNDGVTFADPSETSRVESIKKCYSSDSSDSICAKPVSFDWTSTDSESFQLDASDSEYTLEEDIAEERYGYDSATFFPPQGVAGRRMLNNFGVRGDFDGDNKLEVAWMDCAEEKTTENWETQTCNRVVAMDAGSPGVVFEHKLARQVLRSSGKNSNGTKSYYQSNGYLEGKVLDFNGDGLDDYYMHNSHGMIELNVYLSDGVSLGHSSGYSKTMEELGNYEGKISGKDGTSSTTIWLYNFVILDIDGDKLPDIIRLPHWDTFDGDFTWITLSNIGITDISVAHNNGSGFDDFVQWGESTDYLALHPSNAAHGVSFHDVNGDGLLDIVGIEARVGINTGSSFERQRHWSAEIGFEAIPFWIIPVPTDTTYVSVYPGLSTIPGAQPRTGYSVWAFKSDTTKFEPIMQLNRIADVNGDGLTDFLGLREGGVYVSLSDGTQFLPAVLWSDAITLMDVVPFCNMMECNTPRRGWQVQDVNKDGMADILFTRAWFRDEKTKASEVFVLFSKGQLQDGQGFTDKVIVGRVGIEGEDPVGIEACGSGLPRVGKPSVSEDGEFVVHCQSSSGEGGINMGFPFDESKDVAMKVGIQRHKILTVNESTNRRLTVGYNKLRNPNVYQQEWGGSSEDLSQTMQWRTNYTYHAVKRDSASHINSSYPSIFRGREVVSTVSVEDLGQFNSETAYKYFNQKMSRSGFGSLGFEKVEKTTTLSGQTNRLRTVEEFHQEVSAADEYVLVAPHQVTQCVVSDTSADGCELDDGAKLLSVNQKNWKVRVYGDGVSPRYRPYVREEETKNYDLSTGSVVNTISKRAHDDSVRNSCPSFTELVIDNRTTDTDDHFDAYGTPLNSVENRCDTFGVTGTRTENTNITQDIADSNWCLNQVQDPKVHTWVYDSKTSTSRNSTRHTKYKYFESSNSSAGQKCRIQTETREPGSSSELWLEKTFDYNEFGTQSSVIETVNAFDSDGIEFLSRTVYLTELFDTLGKRTVTTTNALLHEQTEIYNEKFGSLDRVTDANDLVFEYFYDDLGRLTYTESLGVVTTYDYQQCNNCFAYNTDGSWFTQSKTEGQSATRSYFDGLGREVGSRWRGLTGNLYYTGQKYNSLGLPEYVTEPFGGSDTPSNLETRTYFDVLGRITQTDFPTGVSQSVNYTVVDGAATVITTDTADHSTEQRFDALGREKTITDALNIRVSYWHDAQGNVSDIKVAENDEANTNAIDHHITFDLLGRKTKLDDPDIGKIIYTYNAFGHLTEQVNDEDERICYFYDALDRQIKRQDSYDGKCASGIEHNWEYDDGANGLLSRVLGRDTKNRVQNTVYTYTPDYLLPETASQLINGETFTVTNYYDRFNRPVGFAYPTGFALEQRYNSYGYPHQSVNVADGEVLWQANDDDARGNLIDLGFGNGTSVISQFVPETGLLQSRLAMLDSATLQSHLYSFDNEGNLRSREDLRVGITQNFCYDELYRLTDQVIGSSCSDVFNRNYAGSAYHYDIHGNLTQKDEITDYDYTGSGGPHAVSFAKGNTYTYDLAGRMTGGFGGRVIDYSAFGKPTYMGFENGYQTDVVYGALQTRVQRGDVEDGELTSTVYVDKHYERISTPDGKIEHRHYMADWGVHITTEDNAITEDYNVYFTKDHIGSMASKSDDRVAQTIKYHANEPWGRRQDQDWSGVTYDTLSGTELEEMTFGTTRGFTDHEHLDGVGLIHMNGRVYDPVIGRFVSPDPWIQDPKNSQSFNRYTYVWNNPLRYTDPTGEFVFTAIAIGFALWSFYDVADGVAGEIVDIALGEKTLGQATSDFATNKLTDIALDKLTLNAAKLIPKKIKKSVIDKVVKKAKEVTNNLKGTPKTVNKPADVKKDTQSPKPDSECCFVAGTLVLTKDGYTPIEEIVLGDLVWSKNIETGEKDWKPVITLFKKYRPILALTVTASSGEEKLIETTEDHPFYVVGKGWVDASDLLAGDAIETDKLGYVIVESLIDAQRIDITYNFEVEDFNTYYATTLDVLVHNCDVQMKDAGTGAERTSGSMEEVKQAVTDAGFDKKNLDCAKCKLETSIKNRKTEQKRQPKNTKQYKQHQTRIKKEEKELDKVDRRLNDLNRL